MRHFKTLVLCSLVASLATPLLASDAVFAAKKKASDGKISLYGASDAQPKGDRTDTCTPIPIACDDVLTGTTVGNDNVYGYPSGDAVFEFTLAAGADVTLSLCNSDFDTVLYVLDSDPCVSTPLLITSNDDACGLQSELTVNLIAGTYWAVANGYNLAEGNYELAMTCSDPVDPCDGFVSELIECDDVLGGDTSVDGFDDYFAFEVLADTDVTLSLCGSAFDTKLYVHDAMPCDPSANQVAYNDDSCGAQSELTYFAMPGTYYVTVTGYGGSTGVYSLAMTCEGYVDPCDDYTEIAITSGDHGFGTNVGAPDYQLSAAGDVAYTFTLTEESYIQFDTCFDGTDYDTDLALYQYVGPCDPAAWLIIDLDGAYGTDACEGAFPLNYRARFFGDCTIPFPAGDYVAVVSGYGSDEGDFEFDFQTFSCVVVDAVELPVAFDLKQNHPNPFNPTTTIDFVMNETGVASLNVYDLSGRVVATLVDGMTDQGEHSVVFDAADLSSGVYFYTFETAGMSQTQKMILVK